MYTGKDGVSYYKRGAKYYSSTGWLEHEITKDVYESNVKRILSE